VVLNNLTPGHIKFTFRKVEKLCSEKIITSLFQPGFYVAVHPFRINAIITPLPSPLTPAQIMFVVGKKKFKRAVDRNQIKRVMRELYRLNKHQIYQMLAKQNRQAGLALIYTGNELATYNDLKPKFEMLLQKFIHALSVK
jgi:ribonuclease P protein component